MVEVRAHKRTMREVFESKNTNRQRLLFHTKAWRKELDKTPIDWEAVKYHKIEAQKYAPKRRRR